MFSSNPNMNSILITPKNAEELDFLLNLLHKLGVSTQVFNEAEEAAFYQSHELVELGMPENKAQAAQENTGNLRPWNQVKGEA
jgi:CheY-like chemotaxis protein